MNDALVQPRPNRGVFPGRQQDMLQALIETAALAARTPYLAAFNRAPRPGHDDPWPRNPIPTAHTEASGTLGRFPYLADVTRFTASIRSLTEGSS